MPRSSSEASSKPCTYEDYRLKMKLAVTPKSSLRELLEIYDDCFLMCDPSKQMMEDRLLKICTSNSSVASHVMNVHNVVKCSYKYLCVIDFEATCEPTKQFYPNEIIEFPAKLIDTHTLKIVDEFHSYCKPSLFPQLSDFCINLTGINQSDILKAKDFPAVLSDFQQWLKKYSESFIIATDGPNDINHFLVTQCLISGIDFPSYAWKWIDIKVVFQKSYKLRRARLTEMLSFFDMSFLGKLHCGKDDAENIALLVVAMLKDGCIFKANKTMKKICFTNTEQQLYAFLPETHPLSKKKSKLKNCVKVSKEQGTKAGKHNDAESFDMDVETGLDSEHILTTYKKRFFAL